MIVSRGEIYFHKEHVKSIKELPKYARIRYFAIARTLAGKPFRITRIEAAAMIKKSLRQLYRIINRFQQEGIPGLIHRSKRPKTSPNKTTEEDEKAILQVREASGFGPDGVVSLIKESNKRKGISKNIHSSTVYNILVRSKEIEKEKRIQNKWKFFEWGHPNRLIQADLTKFNGVPILTMEDDHSRKGWAVAISDQRDVTVVDGMKKLVNVRYDNLLTDNGSQFSRKNSRMRKYCDEFLNEKHIWTSVHHPQTMGKLSAYQKALKRFLRHQLGGSRNRSRINYWISVFNGWYNNGKYHSSIDTVPEKRYSGQVDSDWYVKLVKALKLESVLTI
jgi:transposase InsO family protein